MSCRAASRVTLNHTSLTTNFRSCWWNQCRGTTSGRLRTAQIVLSPEKAFCLSSASHFISWQKWMTLWGSSFSLKRLRLPAAKSQESLYVIFITNIRTIFRNFKLYKGLHFNFKIASHCFTSQAFLLFGPFRVERLRLSRHLKSSLLDLCPFDSVSRRVSWGKTSLSGKDSNGYVTLSCISVVTTVWLRGDSSIVSQTRRAVFFRGKQRLKCTHLSNRGV